MTGEHQCKPFQKLVSDDPSGLSEAISACIELAWSGKCREHLSEALISGKPFAQENALLVLSELGSRGGPFLEKAAKHTFHESWTARSYLANTLLSCHEFVSPRNLSETISLLFDDHELVQEKYAELVKLKGRNWVLSALREHGDHEAQAKVAAWFEQK